MVNRVEIPAGGANPSLEQEAAAQQNAAEAAATQADGVQPTGDPVPAERPAWLPEKFNTPEDLAKAYAELEKAKGAPKADTEQAAEAAVQSAGLDMAALNAEYAEKGELSQESYDKLAAAGIDKNTVDTYVDAMKSRAEAEQATLTAPVGGPEEYSKIIEWASTGLSDAEIDEYNSVLEGGNPAAIKLAVAALGEKFKASTAQEPQSPLDGRPGGGSASVYESVADLMQDMSHPEYTKNPAFRAKVEAKLGRSNIL